MELDVYGRLHIEIFFFFASGVRSEGICAFEKEREKRREIPLAGRSLNARIYSCVPLSKTVR